MRKAQDLLAFDYASARAYDQDGHLHVRQTNISKAMVCPYYGHEIPNGRALGLELDRVYHLLRDPAELAAAADSFNGKPLLFAHRPVSAEDHDHEGSVGALSNCRWVAPYLKADLVCWPRKAIDAIESGTQKQLSASYRYTARMTPGTFEGVAYDAVMVGIYGNHVALVDRGRAGPDVMVSDAALRARRSDPHDLAAALWAFSGARSPAEIAAATGTAVKPPNKWDFSNFFRKG